MKRLRQRASPSIVAGKRTGHGPQYHLNTAAQSLSHLLRRPEFLIVDGAPDLDKAIAAVWAGVPVQRCTVHEHRNLLAHAPERLHDKITADDTDLIYAPTREEIETRRKAFIRKWRLKHRAVADSLEEAGERLFAFTRLPPTQWRSVRTTDALDKRVGLRAAMFPTFSFVPFFCSAPAEPFFHPGPRNHAAAARSGRQGRPHSWGRPKGLS